VDKRQWREDCTAFLLEQLLEAVLEGQPQSVVVGRDDPHAADLRLQFKQMLMDIYMRFEQPRYNELQIDGSLVTFIGAGQIREWQKTHRIGVGEFWDNSCAHWQGPFWEPSACTVTNLIKEPMRDWRI